MSLLLQSLVSNSVDCYAWLNMWCGINDVIIECWDVTDVFFDKLLEIKEKVMKIACKCLRNILCLELNVWCLIEVEWVNDNQ